MTLTLFQGHRCVKNINCKLHVFDLCPLYFKRCMVAIYIHKAQSWTPRAELLRRIQAMEMMFCCKILRISCKDHVTNKEVRVKIQQAIGPHEDLLSIVKRRRLQWYGHVPVPQVCQQPSCKAQWKGDEDKADRGRGGKATSGNGQAWCSASPKGQWRTGKNGGNWLRNHLWRLSDPRD